MTIHAAVFGATIGTLAGLWWYAEKGPNPVTVLYRAARWLAAGWQWRHTARTAWRNGADLLAVLAVFRQRSPGEPCPLCGGRHCAGCQTPARVTAAWTNHRPRHDFADVPPSITRPLELMTVTERAHELVRQLGQRHWHPYGGLPRWARIRLVAATVAARHGLPLLVGTFAPAGRLP